MKSISKLMAIVALLVFANSALGAITTEEAKQLGTTLTQFGAEKAGNGDGSIPAYTGGIATPPSDYVEGSGVRPDPFADEKPIFSINKSNMSEYAGKLSEGTKALLEKPGYRMDVYKTHRTVAYPQYILENTLKYATTAKLENNGDTLTGVLAAVPFPIPKDGYEVMWNHLQRFHGNSYIEKNESGYIIDASGRASLASIGTVWQEFPFLYKENPSSEYGWFFKQVNVGPPRRAGEAFIVKDPLDWFNKSRSAWQYLAGQRRVKLAPAIAYDTPDSNTAGIATYDDAWGFAGRMDRFDFKLIGKKELYIPYNCYKLVYNSTAEELLTPNYMNPDFVRWELHRVWVVEATLKEGKRHLYKKRVFYVDEDSWHVLTNDEYDGGGDLYKAFFAYIVQNYDAPAAFADTQGHYDLIGGAYDINVYLDQKKKGQMLYQSKPFPDSVWNPNSMLDSGR